MTKDWLLSFTKIFDKADLERKLIAFEIHWHEVTKTLTLYHPPAVRITNGSLFLVAELHISRNQLLEYNHVWWSYARLLQEDCYYNYSCNKTLFQVWRRFTNVNYTSNSTERTFALDWKSSVNCSRIRKAFADSLAKRYFGQNGEWLGGLGSQHLSQL